MRNRTPKIPFRLVAVVVILLSVVVLFLTQGLPRIKAVLGSGGARTALQQDAPPVLEDIPSTGVETSPALPTTRVVPTAVAKAQAQQPAVRATTVVSPALGSAQKAVIPTSSLPAVPKPVTAPSAVDKAKGAVGSVAQGVSATAQKVTSAMFVQALIKELETGDQKVLPAKHFLNLPVELLGWIGWILILFAILWLTDRFLLNRIGIDAPSKLLLWVAIFSTGTVRVPLTNESVSTMADRIGSWAQFKSAFLSLPSLSSKLLLVLWIASMIGLIGCGLYAVFSRPARAVGRGVGLVAGSVFGATRGVGSTSLDWKWSPVVILGAFSLVVFLLVEIGKRTIIGLPSSNVSTLCSVLLLICSFLVGASYTSMFWKKVTVPGGVGKAEVLLLLVARLGLFVIGMVLLWPLILVLFGFPLAPQFFGEVVFFMTEVVGSVPLVGDIAGAFLGIFITNDPTIILLYSIVAALVVTAFAVERFLVTSGERGGGRARPAPRPSGG